MALDFSLTPTNYRVAGFGGFSFQNDPFGSVAQKFNMPSLTEGAQTGSLGMGSGAVYKAPSMSGTANSASGFNWMGGLQAASIGMSIGQAVGSVYSAISSASATGYVSAKQQKIAENNAALARLSAEAAYRQGESQIMALTMSAGQLKARQRVAYATNGVRLDSGSAKEVLATTEVMKRMDVNAARYNAVASAFGYKAAAAQSILAGQQAKLMGEYQNAALMSKAFTSVLETGTTVGERWYKYFGSK